ncbi:MAG: hypothetical protein WAQ98_25035 [Blastocatellia bacterium]
MSNFSSKKLYVGIFSLGFLIPLLFAIYTNHAWEDWFITYKSSKNLALGNGLVYMIGERVHTFTSPLGTLIPAFFSFITANRSDELVLWLFRLFSCVLIGFTSVMLLRMGQQLIKNSLASIFLLTMLLLDLKTIDFSINGMETALMIFFLALLFHSYITPLKQATLIIGLTWGGLMWTRPDSFIYILAISLGFFIFNPQIPVNQTRLERLKQFFLAGIVTTIVYAPWLVFAWLYYGSFVPNTIIAKGLRFAPIELSSFFSTVKEVLIFPVSSLFAKSSLYQVFMPSYSTENRPLDFPIIYQRVGKILAWIAAFAWLLPKTKITARAISFSVFIGHIYLTFIMQRAYPWYFPPVTFLSIFVLALLVDQVFSKIETFFDKELTPSQNIKYKGINLLFRQTVFFCLLLTLSLTLIGTYHIQIQQEVMETNHRKQIGLWLGENAAPTDKVFSECLGYIGFYSQLKMYDFPGLSSPEMVAARRKLKTNDYGELINYLKPEWVVLRPWEIMLNFSKTSIAQFAENYTVAKAFTAQSVTDYPYLSGKVLFEFDKVFFVYRIKPTAKNNNEKPILK